MVIIVDDIVKAVEMCSDLSDECKTEWLRISEAAIKAGTVERLSSKGVFQAIGNLGYRLAFDGFKQCHNLTAMSEEDYDKYLEKVFVDIDNIQEVVALASGIHISIISEMVTNAADYYMIHFAQWIPNN